MRNRLCQTLVERAKKPEMVFLTGDLGFMALEPLAEALKERFINAGVAEQNMVSVAAALAKRGLETWVYSIAPFCYARPFEQIRNDVCMHGLPVRLLGNGGGYGYGPMGSTHYALEDYGVMIALPNMRAYIPAFGDDLPSVIEASAALAGPAYLRLGRDETPKGKSAPPYAPWRCLMDGPGPMVVSIGPLAGAIWEGLSEIEPSKRPSLWVVAELPIDANPPPPEFAAQLADNGRLVVIEEHVRQGGLGPQLCQWAIEAGISVWQFRHLYAKSGGLSRYGSQSFMRRHAGLDPDSVKICIAGLT